MESKNKTDIIYIVTVNDGDYECYSSLNIKAFIDPIEAQKYVDLAKSFQEKLKKAWGDMVEEQKSHLEAMRRREISMDEYMTIAKPITQKQMDRTNEIVKEMREALELDSTFYPNKNEDWDIDEVGLK